MAAMLASVRSALAPRVSQQDVAALAVELHPDLPPDRIRSVFANAGIEHRHLVRPVEWYGSEHGLAERAELACDQGLELGARAARAALDGAGVSPESVDSLVFVTTTAVRSPALDASLAPALGLRDRVRRLPLFGSASLGGCSGLALAADLVAAGDRYVLVVVAELNSLMFVPRTEPPSMEAVVSMALFSDGAAAAVVRAGSSGDVEGGDLELVGRSSTLVPDSLGVMGFDMAGTGLRWRLAPEVPVLAGARVAESVERALAGRRWRLADLEHLLVHPGGTKVLDAVEDALDLPAGRLGWSRRILAEHGNLSAVTVLVMLEAFLQAGPAPGPGLLTAMGPGFGFEHVLFEAGPRR
jgi:alkylresorcinol/alkylpyrone synthase